MMKLYVANINFVATEVDIETLFSKYGDVFSVKLLYDKIGRSRGFGFVEVNDEDAKTMINQLHGHGFMNRNMVVALAKSGTTEDD